MRPAFIASATVRFLERLEEAIPAKWLQEVQRLHAEMGGLLPA